MARMTAQDLNRMGVHEQPDGTWTQTGDTSVDNPKPARSKYRNKPTEYNGRRYDSKAEANRARALDLLKDAGAIASWTPQPRFELGLPENVYVADFDVTDSAGVRWVEDVKGVETAKFRRDVRLWKRYGPCPLRVIKRGVTDYEVPGGGS